MIKDKRERERGNHRDEDGESLLPPPSSMEGAKLGVLSHGGLEPPSSPPKPRIES